jgi:hypothetical protein
MEIGDIPHKAGGHQPLHPFRFLGDFNMHTVLSTRVQGTVLRRDFPLITFCILPSDCSVSTARFCLKDNAHFARARLHCSRCYVQGAWRHSIDRRFAQCKQRRSCRLFLERCWHCPSILLNNCVPSAKDLRFDWCQSVARKMASARWDDGACLQLAGTGSRADNVPWSPGSGSCPRAYGALRTPSPRPRRVCKRLTVDHAGHQNASFGAGHTPHRAAPNVAAKLQLK